MNLKTPNDLYSRLVNEQFKPVTCSRIKIIFLLPVYQIHKEQHINASLDEVWNFIAVPQNLKEITPDYMGFDITSKDLPKKMYPGLIISYVVRPLLGIKTKWVTEITQVREKEFFIDEQRVGPYKLWHHQHHIEANENGVLMKDIITYQPPLGFLGAVANSLIIKRKLRQIFDYRKEALEKRFMRSN